MDDQPHDELTRLRRLDPADGVQTPASLRARISAIVDEQESGAAAPPERRQQARRWLIPVAAVTIAVTAFSAGGLFFSRAGTPSVIAQGASPVPLETQPPGAIAPSVDLGASAQTEGHPDQGAPTSGAQGAWLGPDDWPGSTRRHFSFPSFAGDAGHATVYAVDSASRYSEEEIVRLAKAFGVEGEPVNDPWSWRVGDPANAPGVSISAWDGSFSYDAQGGDPLSDCILAVGRADQEAYDLCRQQVPAPTDEQATAAMIALLDALGFEEDDMLVTLDDSSKLEHTLLVTASRVVDDKATGVTISAYVTHEGITSAYGWLGEIVPLGDYDIVSPAEAARRLNTSAFAPRPISELGIRPVPASGAVPTAPPAVPEPGSPVPWGFSEHTIVSARLGLSTVFGPDSSLLVVPAYEFTDSEDGTWSVIALKENELDKTAKGWF